MKFTSEVNLGSITAKKKVPAVGIANETKAMKDFADKVKFFVPKATYKDDGAILSFANNPLTVGYPLEEGKVRLICVKNKEAYGFGQQLKTFAENFEEKTLSAKEIVDLIGTLHATYGSAGGQEEKIVRAISWANHILERDFGQKYEVDTSEKIFSLELADGQEKDALIKEMIASVDMKRFLQLLSVAGSDDERKKFASKEAAEKIIMNWAKAKVGFYKAFGKKFWLEKEVEIPIAENEMSTLLPQLKAKYPKAAFAIASTRTSDWMENTLTSSWDHYDTWRAIPGLTKRMKLSKAFAVIFSDPVLDMALSEVLQNRLVKGIVRVSIDPYDYLTSSVNNHGWNSCHRITTGEYATGVFGYLCDENTVIAYRTNASEHSYSFFGFEFKGNSKAWRANVLFDLSTASFAIGRQYPNQSEEIMNTIKEILEECVLTKYPEMKFGYVRNDFKDTISDKNNLHYNDFLRTDHEKFLITPKEGSKAPSFLVGSVVSCVYCGKTINSAGHRVSHAGCM